MKSAGKWKCLIGVIKIDRLDQRARSRTVALALSITLSIPLSVAASDLVYQPRNPSFGGDSFNSDHLIGLAERQNQYKDEGESNRFERPSPADQLVRRLESRISSAIAQQAADAILGENENSSDEGRIVFGDQVIEFNRGTETVQLKVIDQAAGTETEISLPLLQVN